MSNDLISRKKVINRFEEAKEKADTLRDVAYLTGVLAIIDCIPTAYDVDAVCNEIQNIPHGYLNCETESEIIEIVRNGGKKE